MVSQAWGRTPIEDLYGKEPPFSDSERKAAGMAPIGTGPGGHSGTTPASFRREMRERDSTAKSAYETGLREGKASRAPARGGQGSGANRLRRSPATSQGLAGTKRLWTGRGSSTVLGTALGLVATAVFLNVLRSGPRGAIDWLGAKFVNKVPGSPAPSSTSASNTKATTSGPNFVVPTGPASGLIVV